ncbi:MAG: branched-chain amino acid transport system II carrier protein [Ferrimonas sp.]
MSTRLSFADTLSLGFMTFAFFLGAGNIIFPPFAGLAAGENWLLAMVGFLVTAVGLPLLALIAIARVGGGLGTMTALLPRWIGVSLALAIFIILGPAFATPRTGLVAYEIGVVPFLGETSKGSQWLFTVVYFALALWLALSPGKLMNIIGKVLTPILMLLLLGLAGSLLLMPEIERTAATGAWAASPFANGFLEGYMTMDTLGALMFGSLLVDIVRRKGISDRNAQARYLALAAVIAAIGLTVVYVSLFYLGVMSADLASNAANGGAILTAYVIQMFGEFGLVILALVVALACLTTAVGLISASAEYFNELWPRISYRQWVALIAVLCALVANVGLSQLIAVSIPVLFLIYPIAMALVFYALVQARIQAPSLILWLLVAMTALLGLLSALKVLAIEWAAGLVAAFGFLPLYEQHLAWLPLTALILLFGLCYRPNKAVSNIK